MLISVTFLTAALLYFFWSRKHKREEKEAIMLLILTGTIFALEAGLMTYLLATHHRKPMVYLLTYPYFIYAMCAHV